MYLYRKTDKDGVVWMLKGKNNSVVFWREMGGPIDYDGDIKTFTPYESHNGVNIKGLVWYFMPQPATITAVNGNTNIYFNLDTNNLFTIGK